MACCNDTDVSSCENPCNVSSVNTAACETLPSQISNFTAQFFGQVNKTEVNGVINWVLPCRLDTGLENNPRVAGEGLACYFLRLFEDGIIGATGPPGPAGSNGSNGHNAYTVTLAGFTQPTLGFPNVIVRTSYNPAILINLYVFIQGSGWYLVTNTDLAGNLWLTLQRPLIGVSGTITAGKLVVPSGYPGESIIGPQGPPGPTGPAGTPGSSWTETHGQTYWPAGTDYAVPVAYAVVNFVTGTVTVTLPTQGTYLLTCTAGVRAIAGIALADIIYTKLYNVSNAADIPGSEQQMNMMLNTRMEELVTSVLYQTDGAMKTVALVARCTNAGRMFVVASRTVLHYVRIA